MTNQSETNPMAGMDYEINTTIEHFTKSNNGLTNEYIFDNKAQDAIVIGYLRINFSTFPEMYKSLDEIIDTISLSYYLGGSLHHVVKIDLDLLECFYQDDIRYEIVKNKIINFTRMSYIPIYWSSYKISGGYDKMITLPTRTDSKIQFTLRMECRVDMPIELCYDKLSNPKHEYIPDFIQPYCEYTSYSVVDCIGNDVININVGNKKDEINKVIMDMGQDYNSGINQINNSSFVLFKINDYTVQDRFLILPIWELEINNYNIQINFNSNHFVQKIKVTLMKNKDMVFDDGYLLDDEGNKLKFEMDQNYVFDGIQDDQIGLFIEL